MKKGALCSRAQLSLEFMVYFGISAAALSLSIALFVGSSSRIEGVIDATGIAAFVADINSNMGIAAATIHVYVPKSICSAVISSTGIEYSNVTYYFENPVSIGSDLCTLGGTYDTLLLSYNSSGMYLLTGPS
jgi:uncharacterized protein (UPF0333 family)